MELPAVNPQADPTYEEGLTPGSVLPALTTCSLDDGELPVLRKIIQVFTELRLAAAASPMCGSTWSRCPRSAGDRAKLEDGARQDLQTTLRYLIDHNCRFC